MKEEEKVLRKEWEEEKTINDQINKKKSELENAKFRLEQAENNYDLETSARIKHGEIPTLEKELTLLREKDSSKMLSDTVNEDSIASIISKWTNIPVTKLAMGEKEKLLNLENEMKKG